MCPHSWRVPGNLSGTFRVVPRIDTGPFESVIVEREVRIECGSWIEPAAGVKKE